MTTCLSCGCCIESDPLSDLCPSCDAELEELWEMTEHACEGCGRVATLVDGLCLECEDVITGREF